MRRSAFSHRSLSRRSGEPRDAVTAACAEAPSTFLEELIEDTLDEIDQPLSFYCSPAPCPARSLSVSASSPRFEFAEQSRWEASTQEKAVRAATAASAEKRRETEGRETGKGRRETGEGRREQDIVEPILPLSSDLAASVDALVEAGFFAEAPLPSHSLLLPPRTMVSSSSLSSTLSSSISCSAVQGGASSLAPWSASEARKENPQSEENREDMDCVIGEISGEAARSAAVPQLFASSGVCTPENSSFSCQFSTRSERWSTDRASLGAVEDREEEKHGFVFRPSIASRDKQPSASSPAGAFPDGLSDRPSPLSAPSTPHPGKGLRETHSRGRSQNALVACLDGLAAHASALKFSPEGAAPTANRVSGDASSPASRTSPEKGTQEETDALSELSTVLEAALKLLDGTEEEREAEGIRQKETATAEEATSGWRQVFLSWGRDSLETKAAGESPQRSGPRSGERPTEYAQELQDDLLALFEAGEDAGEGANLLFVAVGEPFSRLLGAFEPWLERQGRKLTEADRMRYMRQIQVYRQLVELCGRPDDAKDGAPFAERKSARQVGERGKDFPANPREEEDGKSIQSHERAAREVTDTHLTSNQTDSSTEMASPPLTPPSPHDLSSSNSSSSVSSSSSDVSSSSSNVLSSSSNASSSSSLSSSSSISSSVSHPLPVRGKFARLQALLDELREYGEPPEEVLDALMPEAEEREDAAAERREDCHVSHRVRAERDASISRPQREQKSACAPHCPVHEDSESSPSLRSPPPWKEGRSSATEEGTHRGAVSSSASCSVPSPESSSSSSSSCSSLCRSPERLQKTVADVTSPLLAQQREGLSRRLAREEGEGDEKVEAQGKGANAPDTEKKEKKKEKKEEKQKRTEEQVDKGDEEMLRDFLSFVEALETHAGGEGDELKHLLRKPLEKLLEGELDEDELLAFVESIDTVTQSEASWKAGRPEAKKENHMKQNEGSKRGSERSNPEDGCRQQ
ncbi:conserved hypothetical protein [Neospora caninum Liverpool]|uniref:Uncharacterized protein n=1 Tax=Neospora caninum (strain Liverpool) TaxID=572307 RepID=F0VB95_NEOCL|nr:conserved hypothetical protein [Neospora caninum Liverpool]CBZ50879.1 conserved hypothetical protein [Neospora caninum Liverpool]CEL68181.1 TPA: hypothetical protein BN1204_039540 [Neospora caninum Liverpool]|eukprot:XP_003880912.1 conserved hypothetical protein [Neospora caninum Liverpool]